MPKILNKVSQFIQMHGMPAPPCRILVAVSGGADSVALLLLLRALGYETEIAHCNHGLRAESAGEEQWVRDLGLRLGIPCHVAAFSAADFEMAAGDSTQQAARKLRYTFWERLLGERGISHCATGHHADDQLETQVMSFFRGSGPQLLRSIPACRGPFVRPLLCVTKSELISWLKTQGQDWCHDASNDADRYLRNAVRNRLLPLLAELQPGFEERFARQAERYAAQQAWMHATFAKLAPALTGQEGEEVDYINVFACKAEFGEAHSEVFVTWWLDQLGFHGREIADILQLLHGNSGTARTCGARDVLRERDRLWVRPSGEQARPSPITIALASDQRYQFCGDQLSFSTVDPPKSFARLSGQEQHWLDLDRLKPPLVLRVWQIGDRISPVGLQGSKLISDILGDQKRDRFAKARAWVLEDADGIVLVGGYRIAARVAVSAETRRCLRIDRQPSM